MDEIENIKNGLKVGGLHPMELKKSLAHEIAARYHSEKEALEAKEGFEKIFRDGGAPDELDVTLLDIEGDSIWLPALLSSLHMVKSNSEGRRLVKQGAVTVDGQKIVDENSQISAGGEYLIKAGKRRFAKVLLRTSP